MRIFRRKVKAEPAADAPRCVKCGSTSLKRVLATHPVPLTGELEGKRLDIYRVEMDKCRGCGTLTPTVEGKAKIERCTRTGIEAFHRLLRTDAPRQAARDRLAKRPASKPVKGR